MSDEEILSLAKEGKGKRGVKAEWIKEMAEWLKIQQNINKLYDKKNKIIEALTVEFKTSGALVVADYKGSSHNVVIEIVVDGDYVMWEAPPGSFFFITQQELLNLFR